MCHARGSWHTACQQRVPLHWYQPDHAHLSNASSSEFPESTIAFWASLCRSPSAGILPIRMMVSPSCRPHLAARLPGFTCIQQGTRHLAGVTGWWELRRRSREGNTSEAQNELPTSSEQLTCSTYTQKAIFLDGLPAARQAVYMSSYTVQWDTTHVQWNI